MLYTYVMYIKLQIGLGNALFSMLIISNGIAQKTPEDMWIYNKYIEICIT